MANSDQFFKSFFFSENKHYAVLKLFEQYDILSTFY